MTVVDKKNISKAAEALGSTQSQLSKMIAQLEGSLGSALFIRQSRGVELTKFGESFHDSVSSLIAQWDYSSLENLSQQRLRIGFHSSIGMEIYPRLIHPLHREYQVEIQLTTSLEVTRMVADLRLDFGFVINPQRNPDIIAKKVTSAGVALYARAQLPERGILYYHPDMIFLQRTLKKFRRFKQIALPDYEMIAFIIKTQLDAIGILPESVARRYHLIEHFGAKLFPLDLSLITHRDRLKSPAIKLLFEKLKSSPKFD